MTAKKKLLRERELAALFGFSIHTLRQDRRNDRHIPFIRIGKAVWYDPIRVELALQELSVGGKPKVTRKSQSVSTA